MSTGTLSLEPSSLFIGIGVLKNADICHTKYFLYLYNMAVGKIGNCLKSGSGYTIAMAVKAASFLILVYLLTFEAQASCWAGGDSEIRRYQILADSAPLTALPLIDSALREARQRKQIEKVGWLISAQAAALVNLSRDEDALKAVAKASGLIGLSPELRADILNRQMPITYEEPSPELTLRIDELSKIARKFPKGSSAHVCTQNTIANLYRAQGDFERAVRISGDAYREAKQAKLDDAAGYIALTLSVTISMTGDLEEAEALALEVEKWATQKRYSVFMVFIRLHRAQLAISNQPQKALKLYKDAARRAKEIGVSPTGGEMGVCRYYLKVEENLPLARKYCQIARQNVPENENIIEFIIDKALGDIELADNRPRQALAIFDSLLAQPMVPVLMPHAGKTFEARAQAHAMRGEFEAAYKDLASAAEIASDVNRSVQDRDMKSLRARFAWDRQRIANAELERDLALAEARDKVRNTWLMAGGAGALGVSAMLLWIIYSGRRHRHQLEGLAVEARELARTKADLLATMSHEIRAPLGSLVLASARLAQSAGIPNDSRQKAEYLGAAADRLINQLDDLLLFSRIDSRQLPVSSDWFDIAAVVANAIKLAEPKVDAAGMAIRSTFGPGAPEKVYGDANRTAQLLTNLIENAARHSGGKLIEVKIEGAPDGQYAMTVSDDGVGIAEDALPLMMRSFAQVDGSMSSAEGFGLGLAICKGLAELMGGSIALDSPPGSGLHVKICMPAEVTLSKAA
jgi:signal transduction histidine kinase